MILMLPKVMTCELVTKVNHSCCKVLSQRRNGCGTKKGTVINGRSAPENLQNMGKYCVSLSRVVGPTRAIVFSAGMKRVAADCP